MRQTSFKSAELKVSYTCNMGCRFCWVGDRRTVSPLSNQEQEEGLAYIYNNPSIEEIHISGGEPTLRKDLSSLLEKIKQKKFKAVVMHTNALAFADPEYAKKVTPYLTHAVISLQAATPERHEYITRLKGKFDVQLEGIQNVIGQGVHVAINTVMARSTLPDLPKLADLLSGLKIAAWFVTFPFITGWAKKMQEELLPHSLKEVQEHLLPALQIAIEKKLLVVPNGLPFCYFPDNVPLFIAATQQLHQLGLCGFGSQRKMIDSNEQGDLAKAFAHEVIAIQHTQTCTECCFKGICNGFWPELLEKQGWPQLQALL